MSFKQLLEKKINALARAGAKVFREFLKEDVDDEEKMILRKVYDGLITLHDFYLEIYLKYIELEEDKTNKE
ncbi:hypothetical protein [Paraclostridium dentum]|uniref:hypothetical protein n=1 Tax=Paraclostridium dentum TaxID=2662455 RepID=UPI0034642B1A